jgi:hypothetical protein
MLDNFRNIPAHVLTMLFFLAFVHVYKTLTRKRTQSPLPLRSALLVMSLDLRGIACYLSFALVT